MSEFGFEIEQSGIAGRKHKTLAECPTDGLVRSAIKFKHREHGCSHDNLPCDVSKYPLFVEPEEPARGRRRDTLDEFECLGEHCQAPFTMGLRSFGSGENTDRMRSLLIARGVEVEVR